MSIESRKVVLARPEVVLNETKPTHKGCNFTEKSENADDETGANVPYYVVRGRNKKAILSTKLINYVYKAATLSKGEAIVYPEDRDEALKLAQKHGFIMPNEMISALKQLANQNEAALVQFSTETDPYTIGEGDDAREVTNFTRTYSVDTPKSVFIKDMEREGIVATQKTEEEVGSEIF